MAPFAFYALSEEDQATFRRNPRRCVALLRPCKPLADKLATTGGIYAPLTEDDERLLQSFHLIAQSFQGYQYEGAFDQLCQQAGLLHSDVGLLVGRIETLYQQREPTLYQAEVFAMFHQWLHPKEEEEQSR